MTVKELIETLKTCDENANVVIEQQDGDTFGIGEVNSINANGLYVIRKAGSNRAGFIKFNDQLGTATSATHSSLYSPQRMEWQLCQ